MAEALDRLIAGDVPHILVGCERLPQATLLLPGSFNPFHRGHEALLLAAEKITGREGLLELSVSNVDKPPLSMVEVERRLLRLKGAYSIVLTSAPTFSEKAELFPGAWFVLGYDTAVRLLDPNYAPHIPAMLAHFKTLGSRFVVGGRLSEGMFKSLERLAVPAEYADLFIPISEHLFREDVSSSGLRSTAK